MIPSVTAAQAWDWFNDTPLLIVAVVVGAVVLRWVLHRVIRRFIGGLVRRGESDRRTRAERVLAHAAGFTPDRNRQRLLTLGSLLRSMVTFVVGLVALLTVMSLVGVPLAPLLASAGVGGVALGFGAQSLVKDFLSGIFMILEDQYGVGDVVDTGEVIGTVESVSLRITSIRDVNGVLWHVRNGEIVKLGNRSQGWAQAFVDLPVAYDADASAAMSVLDRVVDAFDSQAPWSEKLLERPQVLGVESISGATMTLRVLVKCVAGEEFSVQRELRQLAKSALDEAGIPGPPMTLPPGGSG